MNVVSWGDLRPVRDPVAVAGRRTRFVGLPVIVGAAAGAAAVGLLAGAYPVLTLGAALGSALVALVWWRPEWAVYALTAATPLVVGIDRDRLIPLLRPNEALLGLLVVVLCVRAVTHMALGARPNLSMGPVAISVLALAVTSSFLPMFFMVLRGRAIEMDDITNAAVLWKYLAVYALVRYAIRTQRQVLVCLWISMSVATVVGLLAIAQSLGVLGVRALLIPYYAPFGYTAGFSDPRAGSTIGLPAAVADFMILNLGLAAGLWWKDRRRAWLLGPFAVVYVFATFSAAEFSSVLGLLIAVITIAVLVRRLDLLRYALLVLPVAVVVLWPTVENRIIEFQSLHGIPQSWLVRWFNLENYFWPQLFSGSNALLGVRPSARVPVDGAFGYVWIESGYTWLLWGGGVPLAAAYVYFTWATLRATGRVARTLSTYSAIAALTVFATKVSMVFLMVFDPHITYRGSADALFALLALALAGSQTPMENTAVSAARAEG
jgi:hypothetical protein